MARRRREGAAAAVDVALCVARVAVWRAVRAVMNLEKSEEGSASAKRSGRREAAVRGDAGEAAVDAG